MPLEIRTIAFQVRSVVFQSASSEDGGRSRSSNPVSSCAIDRPSKSITAGYGFIQGDRIAKSEWRAIAYNSNRFCTHLAKTMQEIEVTGTIDQQGYIQLDHPLTISDRKNVRIILLIPETDEDIDEDLESPNLFGFLPKRVDPLAFQQEMRDEWNR